MNSQLIDQLNSQFKTAYQFNDTRPINASGQNRQPVQNPTAIVERELAKTLTDFTPVAEPDAADFTPQAVADRITGFIENAILQRAGSDIEAQSMLQQAKQGVTKGLAEARDILSSMAQLTDEVSGNIDATEALIFEGLEQLKNSADVTDRNQQMISESAASSSLFRQTSEASITIMTQEGDLVEVSYSAFMQESSTQNYTADQQGSAYSYDYSRQNSAIFQFSVQGDLDAEEQQAINDFLNNTADIASQFFKGDVQSAFNAAMELGFDSEEIKSFSLDFQQSSYAEVVETYQRTEQMINPLASLADSGPVDPGPAINVISQMQQLIEQTKENALIEQPETTIKSLLANMLDNLNQEIESPLHDYIKDIIE